MRRTIVITVGSLALSGLLAPAHAAGAGPAYTVIDLGTLGGTSIAYAISNSSPPAVAGFSLDASGAGRAFLWSAADGMRDLGPAFDSGFGIDADHRVVGSSMAVGGPFVWTAQDGMRSVGSLGGLPDGGSASDVHATGGIVGAATTSGGGQHAFRQVAGTMTDLGTLGGPHSVAQGVNASGLVVGISYTADGRERAVLWDAAGTIRDLGVLGGSPGRSVALSLNDAGVVVGFSSDRTGATRAFVHDGSTMRDLGALPVRRGTSYAYAHDINNRGQVVGFSLDHAVLWQSGKVIDLNTQVGKGSGWVLRRAQGINEAGWIVGYGTTQGNDRAFLLVPR